MHRHAGLTKQRQSYLVAHFVLAVKNVVQTSKFREFVQLERAQPTELLPSHVQQAFETNFTGSWLFL